MKKYNLKAKLCQLVTTFICNGQMKIKLSHAHTDQAAGDQIKKDQTPLEKCEPNLCRIDYNLIPHYNTAIYDNSNFNKNSNL